MSAVLVWHFTLLFISRIRCDGHWELEIVGNSTLPESAVFTDGVYVLGGCRSSLGCGQVMAYIGQLGLALLCATRTPARSAGGVNGFSHSCCIMALLERRRKKTRHYARRPPDPPRVMLLLLLRREED